MGIAVGNPTFETLLAGLLVISVVDGDTVEHAGDRWRLVDLDAPEIHHAKCAAERELGLKAAARLIALIAEKGSAIEPTSQRRDRWGRKLGRLTIGGEPWADIAVREGLAVYWNGRGRRPDWCGT